MKHLFLMLIAFTVITFTLRAEIISAGKGSYTNALPAGASVPCDTDGKPVMPSVTSRLKGKPIPSNKWWSSAVFKRYPDNAGSETMYAHPLAFIANNSGLLVSYPDSVVISTDKRAYSFPFKPDLQITMDGLDGSGVLVDNFSDWTVSLDWDQGTIGLTATIGHGLPFVYVDRCRGDSLWIRPQASYRVFYANDTVVAFTVNGHHYASFIPGSSTWVVSNGFKVSLKDKRYVSLCILPDTTRATLDYFTKHAYVFVNSASVSWSYNEKKSTVTTQYSLRTSVQQGSESLPLLALYPHQWRHTAILGQSYSYASPRGEMKTISNSGFTTTMRYPGILPSIPYTGADSKESLKSTLVNELSGEDLIPHNKDTYWTGKALGRISCLVHIADECGLIAIRDTLIGALKTTLQNWFSAEVNSGALPLFYYDTTWASIIGFPSNYGADKELNDHHFHYGYFIGAAATIALFDTSWAHENAWGGMVQLLINDIANIDTVRESRFCRLRCFDTYAGHSWASGHGAFAAGNNQESSSESMNCATGLIMWGLATGDTTIRNLGIYLYTTEQEAIKNYWFDIDNTTFPADFPHTTLGILWGNGGAYATWWTPNPEEIHGINFLPITGGSLYLGQWPGYLDENYRELLRGNGAPPQEWKDIIWEVRALYAPDSASAWLQSNPVYTAEEGESKTHTMHWIHSLALLGTIDTSVTADCPSYAVFRKNGTRQYIAFNDGFAPKTVTFSDGLQMLVEARSYALGYVAVKHDKIRRKSAIKKAQIHRVLIVNGERDVLKNLGTVSVKTVYTLDGKAFNKRAIGSMESKKSKNASCLYILKW